MTNKELIEFMGKIDRERGNVKTTVITDTTIKRRNRICMFSETTQAVMQYLDEKKIKYHLCEWIKSRGKSRNMNILTDIFIPEYNIVMRQLDVNDEVDMRRATKYFNAMRGHYHPIYIRSNETTDFVILKLNNTILKAMSFPLKGFKSMEMVLPPKPKRKRITAVKIEPIKRSINK